MGTVEHGSGEEFRVQSSEREENGTWIPLRQNRALHGTAQVKRLRQDRLALNPDRDLSPLSSIIPYYTFRLPENFSSLCTLLPLSQFLIGAPRRAYAALT